MSINDSPKILTIDIETSPILNWSWGPKYETNIIKIVKESKILSFSAKWLHGKQITKGLPDYKGYKKGTFNIDDKEIIKDIWNLLDESDIVVTQNGRAFDTKTINSRIIFHKLSPPSPYKIVDTRTVAKGNLRLASYSLDDMCSYYGIGKKSEHEGFALWEKCMEGDMDAWKRMLKYNAHDVLLTEELYLKLRPWMASHPNLGIFNGKLSCTKCGSTKIQSRGFTITRTKKYKRAQCQSCGGWLRYTLAEKESPQIVVGI